MAPRLLLQDETGQPVSMDDWNPVDLGSIPAGSVSIPQRLALRNAGDVPLYFARVRASFHPADQRGGAAVTQAATEFSTGEHGAFSREIELGTLAPGEEKPLWVRWRVLKGAEAGAVVWAVEALASE